MAVKPGQGVDFISKMSDCLSTENQPEFAFVYVSVVLITGKIIGQHLKNRDNIKNIGWLFLRCFLFPHLEFSETDME
jgi:hypothetical protein